MPRTVFIRAAFLAVLAALAFAGAFVLLAAVFPPRPGAPLPPAASVIPATAPPGAAVLVGAGDVGTCDADADEATARLLDAIEGTVFVAGDDAYPHGRADDFEDCYAPTWGRHRARTLPTPGNHEYDTRGAAGYLDYFGTAARPGGTTWYATDVGAWRVVVLDSNCPSIEGGCATDSPQVRWLEAELEANPRRCTVAIWHHPRFSSGEHGDDVRTDAFWRLLAAGGADVIVNGHDHDYERFAPQDPDGRPDEAAGIREFVVGTGGATLRGFHSPRPNSEVREAGTHGVLRLTLREDRYDWTFLPVDGATFADAGTSACH